MDARSTVHAPSVTVTGHDGAPFSQKRDSQLPRNSGPFLKANFRQYLYSIDPNTLQPGPAMKLLYLSSNSSGNGSKETCGEPSDAVSVQTSFKVLIPQVKRNGTQGGGYARASLCPRVANLGRSRTGVGHRTPE